MRGISFLTFVAALFLAFTGCGKAPQASVSTEPVTWQEAGLETGDLLFIGIPMDYGEGDMAGAIGDATGAGEEINYIHTSILEIDDEGRAWIIDATLKHGVDRHPIDTMFSDFVLHRIDRQATFEVMRLKDNRNAAGFVASARSMAGEGYDLYFLSGNGEHYCTELVYDTYLGKDGSHLFETVPMNFKNAEGKIPQYWENLFAKLGSEVPQDMPGTNPRQMHESPLLRHVAFLVNPYQK
ncbi:MAG: hypothetical protein K6G79_09165 [Bacteroidales bacterium]|nr:hypothetical protein [Bacteroidales bacterium]